MMGSRPLGPERGVDEVDELRVHRLGVIPVETITLEIGRLHGNQRNIGPREEPVDNRGRLGRGQIERNGPLAGVGGEVGAPFATDRGEVSHGVARRRFDLDDIGAEPGEQASTVRDRRILAELDDLDAVEHPRQQHG